MRWAMHGAAGRMGRTIVRCAAEKGFELVGAIDRSHSGKDAGELAGIGPVGVAVGEDVAAGLLGAQVVIDFSTASAVSGVLRAAARAEVAIVSGTTKLDAMAMAQLDEAARHVPVLWAPNTSLGVHVLAEVVKKAVELLGPGYDVEIVEAHHGKKIDAPSGTAVRLGEAVKAARAGMQEVHGRAGDVGARKAGELGYHAIRGGDVIGDHTVHLLGQGERLELTHRATSRDLFALGALRAAQFVIGKPPGRYTIADVVSPT